VRRSAWGGAHQGPRGWVRVIAVLSVLAGGVLSSSVNAEAAPPSVVSEATVDVASSSATLSAEVNPNGGDTTYHFEYGTSTAYGTKVPVPDGSAGSGTASVLITAHLQALTPDTVYRYRLIAASTSGTVPGPDQTFKTQPAAGGLALPDGRAWEMVSPANKYGARLESLTNEGGVIQASENGTAVTYVANAPIVANPPGNSSLQETQVISARGPEQWVSRDIATPNSSADGVFVGRLAEYLWFSPDLAFGLVEPKGATPLAAEASEKTIYLREPLRSDGSEIYRPLVTGSNVAPGVQFGYHLHFVSATDDLSHVVIASDVGLTARSEEPGLYEWIDGVLHLVNVLPAGESAARGAFLGNINQIVRHAVSSDGSRVVWSGREAGGSEQRHLYMRDLARGGSVQIDAVGPGGEVGEAKPEFQTASEDGAKVFFTDTQRLTGDSTASGAERKPDLYEFAVTNSTDPLGGTLTDLTVDRNVGESAGVQGVLPGASTNGGYVYFVAQGVLSSSTNARSEAAVAGANNLYVLHREGAAWTTTFIATLSESDAPDWELGGQLELNRLTSRVSPSGHYIAFMSARGLTGYDNVDANSPPGEPRRDEEVFIYDATANRLACASCNPTGARPVGVLDRQESGEGLGLLVDRPQVWQNRWLAGSIPGWTAAEQNRALYQSRYLSDSGRLFFNAADALVAQDTNGKEDVYEYEPRNVGGCERAEGCVNLLSSGTSGHESAFLDASVSGNDAFFLTAAQLTSQDYDTSFDVYDARVCSGAAPCLAQPAMPPAACDTGDTCRPVAAGQPAIFGPPATMTVAGAGNLVGGAANTRPATRAEKLARALRACRRKPKRKRVACEALARKRYGTHKPPRKASRRNKNGRA
jgi:hypothetical protein